MGAPSLEVFQALLAPCLSDREVGGPSHGRGWKQVVSRSLPTQTILWFCDSMTSCWAATKCLGFQLLCY